MRLIFLIAAPRDAAGPYIQTVAKVARLLRSPSYEGQLLAAESAEIAQLIDKFDRQHPRDIQVKRTEDGRVIHPWSARAPCRGSRETEASIFMGEDHEEGRVYHPGA